MLTVYHTSETISNSVIWMVLVTVVESAYFPVDWRMMKCLTFWYPNYITFSSHNLVYCLTISLLYHLAEGTVLIQSWATI
ncbi:hypothetical protein F5Y02DRAFT_393502 [Annulohypoxylon stygium]|nr:hypothetical protein F5Y02DRAFT_393502 [Annulohypoxylon stygium]